MKFLLIAITFISITSIRAEVVSPELEEAELYKIEKPVSTSSAREIASGKSKTDSMDLNEVEYWKYEVEEVDLSQD